MKFYSYFDEKKHQSFLKYFLALYLFIFYSFFFWGGLRQITASFTCGQRYSMTILCTSHLYPLPPPPTRIGGENDFSKPCPVPWGHTDANNPALIPNLHNKEVNPWPFPGTAGTIKMYCHWSSLFPLSLYYYSRGGGGGGAVDTNDWCIKLNRICLFISHCHIESEVEESITWPYSGWPCLCNEHSLSNCI